jgi:hypothetical protein
MGGWSLGDRQDRIIGGFHHGGALALTLSCPPHKKIGEAELNVGTRECCIDAKIARIMHHTPLLRP